MLQVQDNGPKDWEEEMIFTWLGFAVFCTLLIVF